MLLWGGNKSFNPWLSILPFVPEVAQVVLVVVAVDSPRALSAAEVLLRPLLLWRSWRSQVNHDVFI